MDEIMILLPSPPAGGAKSVFWSQDVLYESVKPSGVVRYTSALTPYLCKSANKYIRHLAWVLHGYVSHKVKR